MRTYLVAPLCTEVNSRYFFKVATKSRGHEASPDFRKKILKLGTPHSWVARLVAPPLCTEFNSRYLFRGATDSCDHEVSLNFKKILKLGTHLSWGLTWSPPPVYRGQFAVPFQGGDRFV